jgi:hypothetical protein
MYTMTTLPKIVKARWTYADGAGFTDAGGHPVLVLGFEDGRRGVISFPCKWLYYGFPAVSVAGLDGLPPLQFPGNEEIGLDPLELRGCTDDAATLDLARGFDNAVRLGNFFAQDVTGLD